MFDASGNLTDAGKKQINELMNTYKLPQNATWEDALQALRKYKDSLPEIKLPKLEIMNLKSVNFKELQKISKERVNGLNKWYHDKKAHTRAFFIM